MPAGLPESDCALHKPPVASMNALNWAHIIPNLVGNPKSKPSASASSFGVMMGASPFGGACILSRTSFGNVSGTCLNIIYTYSGDSLPKPVPQIIWSLQHISSISLCTCILQAHNTVSYAELSMINMDHKEPCLGCLYLIWTMHVTVQAYR